MGGGVKKWQNSIQVDVLGFPDGLEDTPLKGNNL